MYLQGDCVLLKKKKFFLLFIYVSSMELASLAAFTKPQLRVKPETRIQKRSTTWVAVTQPLEPKPLTQDLD